MPGKRISELTALSGAASANNDDLLIFDSGTPDFKDFLATALGAIVVLPALLL